MNRLLKLLTAIVLGGLANPAWTQQPPRCPTVEDIVISPEAPTASSRIGLAMSLYPGTSSAEWELMQQEPGRLHFDLWIGWGGGVGIPINSTLLDPQSPGNYEILISPYLGFKPEDVCPLLSIPLTVAGGPSAAVPAPLLSLPGLLLLTSLFGLLGWAALRPR